MLLYQSTPKISSSGAYSLSASSGARNCGLSIAWIASFGSSVMISRSPYLFSIVSLSLLFFGGVGGEYVEF